MNARDDLLGPASRMARDRRASPERPPTPSTPNPYALDLTFLKSYPVNLNTYCMTPPKRSTLAHLGPNPSQPLKPWLRNGNRRKSSTKFSLNPQPNSTSPRHPAPHESPTRINPPRPLPHPHTPPPAASRAERGRGGRVSRSLPAGACSAPHASCCSVWGLWFVQGL